MIDENHSQIMLAIGELKGLVNSILSYQNIQNGRTSKLEGKVELIEKQMARADGRLTAYGWVFGVVVALIGIILPITQIYLNNVHK